MSRISPRRRRTCNGRSGAVTDWLSSTMDFRWNQNLRPGRLRVHWTVDTAFVHNFNANHLALPILVRHLSNIGTISTMPSSFSLSGSRLRRHRNQDPK
jgi:hypothetical protein